MLIVETIARIRRAHFVQGKPIKAICRELKISRKVVRKVLRSGETAFEYERTVQPMPKIGPFKNELDRILAGNEAKATRERLTLIRVFEELRGLGYDGGRISYPTPCSRRMRFMRPTSGTAMLPSPRSASHAS